jgi:hypothetical protein
MAQIPIPTPTRAEEVALFRHSIVTHQRSTEAALA